MNYILKQHEMYLIMDAYRARKFNYKVGVQPGSEYLNDAETLIKYGLLVSCGHTENDTHLFELTELGIKFCEIHLK